MNIWHSGVTVNEMKFLHVIKDIWEDSLQEIQKKEIKMALHANKQMIYSLRGQKVVKNILMNKKQKEEKLYFKSTGD